MTHQDVLILRVEVAMGATLPRAIETGLSLARRTGCTVLFEWLQQTVRCGPEDTYQGVQRRVGRTPKPAAGKAK
jgi:hypothetical protein